MLLGFPLTFPTHWTRIGTTQPTFRYLAQLFHTITDFLAFASSSFHWEHLLLLTQSHQRVNLHFSSNERMKISNRRMGNNNDFLFLISCYSCLEAKYTSLVRKDYFFLSLLSCFVFMHQKNAVMLGLQNFKEKSVFEYTQYRHFFWGRKNHNKGKEKILSLKGFLAGRIYNSIS